jgi:hypothetical protein
MIKMLSNYGDRGCLRDFLEPAALKIIKLPFGGAIHEKA